MLWKTFKSVAGNAIDGFMTHIHIDLEFEGAKELPPVCRTFNLMPSRLQYGNSVEIVSFFLGDILARIRVWKDCMKYALRSKAKL